MTDPPTGYIVDVCRYCGRLAVWPGCKHWQKHEGWCLPVRVTTSAGDRRKLAAEMLNMADRDVTP